jgi:protein-disulfide isomerase
MGKNNPSNPPRRSGAEPPPGQSAGLMPAVTVAAVAVVIVMAGMILHEARQQRSALEERMSLLEGQISALGNKVDAAVKSAAQPHQPSGPDPNKVYAVKTDGSPAEGPKSAPVTIAEFSDFQ